MDAANVASTRERTSLLALLTLITATATLALVVWRGDLLVSRWLFAALAAPCLAFSILLRVRADTIGREGRLLDLWSIPHFLGGTFLGLLDIGLLWVTVLVIWWECVESISHVFEHFSNRLLDILLALVGWTLAQLLVGASLHLT